MTKKSGCCSRCFVLEKQLFLNDFMHGYKQGQGLMELDDFFIQVICLDGFIDCIIKLR